MELKNLQNQKYVLTRTDDVLLYDDQSYLFHVTNLTKILTPYRKIVTKEYKPTAQETIWIKKIEALADQLNEHKRYSRSLNFLGSALKFITGNPDHDDFIEMETAINKLINNNQKQRLVNSRFEKLIDELHNHTLTNNLIIEQVYDQLILLVRTINAAKNNEYLTESLNIVDIKEVIQHELITVPIINILEYADVHIAGTGDLFIAIYKYPILNNHCKLFKITPISFRHGKIKTDEQIAYCNKEYIRVTHCENYLGRYICQRNNETDTCIIPLLEDKNSKCTVIQEYNSALLEIDEGLILLDGDHTVENKSITGTHLVTYTDKVNIDGILYRNLHDRLVEAIHNKHHEDFEIEKIIESDKENAFNNIDSIRKFIIPYEEHPFRSTFYSLLIIVTVIGIIIFGLKLYKYFLIYKQKKQAELYYAYYNTVLGRIRKDRGDLF